MVLKERADCFGELRLDVDALHSHVVDVQGECVPDGDVPALNNGLIAVDLTVEL